VWIDDVLAARLFRQAKGDRWNMSPRLFAEALDASADRVFAGKQPRSSDIERYLQSLHLEDLAVACACAAGDETAWEHVVREQRPLLYRAADAMDASGGARELADSLYADLYGLEDRGGKRQSLFCYFHGRSSLATWLRAVLAQRYIDRLRAQRRVESLPDEESPAAIASGPVPAEPDRPRYLRLIAQALGRAVSRLEARDRLRLGCYYAQEMRLAQIGRLLHEHEGTVSRHLARTRRRLREDVEHQLGAEAGLTDAQMTECFESVMGDAGAIDLSETLGLSDMLEAGAERKGSGRGRSK
jgi:RNA polymerase sigma-70 factor (ECF subfamily)